jgi:hypothetical protein
VRQQQTNRADAPSDSSPTYAATMTPRTRTGPLRRRHSPGDLNGRWATIIPKRAKLLTGDLSIRIAICRLKTSGPALPLRPIKVFKFRARHDAIGIGIRPTQRPPSMRRACGSSAARPMRARLHSRRLRRRLRQRDGSRIRTVAQGRQWHAKARCEQVSHHRALQTNFFHQRSPIQTGLLYGTPPGMPMLAQPRAQRKHGWPLGARPPQRQAREYCYRY